MTRGVTMNYDESQKYLVLFLNWMVLMVVLNKPVT